ncbi:MAG TPA: hypothetical protein VM620_00040 [Hyphomicrobium sp.]|jgi:hypothetical protein|nr:hypothetical protein [Hyphomicrobium sp.]
MKWNWAAAASAALIVSFVAPLAQADSISSVENARAKDRAGYYLDRQDREKLRRYGRNDDYGYYPRGYGYGYYDGYYGDPGVSVHVGPGGVGVYGY